MRRPSAQARDPAMDRKPAGAEDPGWCLLAGRRGCGGCGSRGVCVQV